MALLVFPRDDRAGCGGVREARQRRSAGSHRGAPRYFRAGGALEPVQKLLTEHDDVVTDVRSETP